MTESTTVGSSSKCGGGPPPQQQQQQQQQQQRHNIAMVCDFFYPRLGGVENHIWSLSYHLIQLGHKVIVITHGYNGSDRKGVRYLPGPLKVYYCPILPMTDEDTMPVFTASLPILRHIWIREQINIVHAHQATSTMASESVVYAAIMASASNQKLGGRRIKSVYTDHSLFGFDDIASVILNRVLQTSLCTVNAAICVSHICRENFILRTHMAASSATLSSSQQQPQPQPRVRVIPNAVTAEHFTPPTRAEVLERDCGDGGRIKIVVVSRLVYRKGVDLLVGIIPNVCHHYDNNVDFIIGGDGSKLLALQEMIERERLQDRVQFLGSVPHWNVRNVLCSGHVFLNCSLTESFCIAILEAASTGMTIVSTNVGGVPEVLPTDMIYLANPTVPDLSQQLFRAVDHVRQQQIHPTVDPMTLHQRVKEMYSWKRVALETVQVYDSVVLDPVKTLQERMACYMSLGGMSGLVACFIALTIEIWYLFVEWWQPEEKIDIVPDLVKQCKNQDIANK